ncbi:MAG: glycosyltransferase family 39 protein [Acidobacteriaceae bacterium]|nr:glycosyltransferase family 39 protein [Acidobacteriaceae bacterium]
MTKFQTFSGAARNKPILDPKPLNRAGFARTGVDSVLPRCWANARTSCVCMVLVALTLRIGYIVVAHTYRFKAVDDHFGFGFEMGRIGRSLAVGQGFSNPFHGVTGRTAWEPPLYPFLIAGVFKLLGVYTWTSAVVLLIFNSLCSAITCVPMFQIARRCFDERVAVWSAWAWALLPAVIFWSTRYVWETSLATLLLAGIFWLVLLIERQDRLIPWLGFGALWGVAALTNTALLSFLPACGIWVWYRRAKQGKRSLSGVLIASLMFAACVTPWIARNYGAFGQFIFIRSNLGAELRLGNGPGANGTWMDYLHPTKNAEQLDHYKQMGEIAYVAERKSQAVEYIREDYSRFARLCLKRFVYFWAGPPRDTVSHTIQANSLYFLSSVLAILGLARALLKRLPGAWLMFWLLVLYPLPYYMTFVLPRYRHPIEPELLMLLVYGMLKAFRRDDQGSAVATHQVVS